MKYYKVTLVLAVPDNFDEDGVVVNIEENLYENPDIDDVTILNVENFSKDN